MSMRILGPLSLLTSLLITSSPFAAAADQDSTVDYHADVSRLMQKHCIQCHRENGGAPFSLESFEDVEANAPMIQEVIRRGTMPPWFAAPEADGAESQWVNDPTLPEADKVTMAAWIKSGRPEGDVADGPESLTFPDGWNIGKPDAVYKAREVNVKATGVMPYEYLVIQTDEDSDRWVQSVQIRPSRPEVVHHVLVMMVPPGKSARDLNGIDYWAAYAPGNGTHIYADGYGRKLPKGSKLVLSMHYTPNGVATVDKTEIAVQFTKKAPKFEVRTASLVNTDFTIPPGADNHKITATVKLPRDIKILGYFPHSHLRGKAARFEVISRTGESDILLDVPGYDFNWQLFYEYSKPKSIRRGSTLKYTAWYDNSENNPANPDPKQAVYWGEQTFDEMHLGYVEFFIPRRR
jgi:mono/diheme cytochrome c family protein